MYEVLDSTWTIFLFAGWFGDNPNPEKKCFNDCCRRNIQLNARGFKTLFNFRKHVNYRLNDSYRIGTSTNWTVETEWKCICRNLSFNIYIIKNSNSYFIFTYWISSSLNFKCFQVRFLCYFLRCSMFWFLFYEYKIVTGFNLKNVPFLPACFLKDKMSLSYLWWNVRQVSNWII